MENKVSKNVLIAGAVIVVLGLIVMFVSSNPNPAQAPVEDEQTATTTTPVTTTATTAVVKTSATSGTPAASVSYQKALELYSGNKRIQLSGGSFCQASPTNVTYKNGTSIMIDNRSAQTRTVKLGTTYTIKGYGFVVVELSSDVLPKTLLMDCGRQQNVATILIQK